MKVIFLSTLKFFDCLLKFSLNSSGLYIFFLVVTKDNRGKFSPNLCSEVEFWILKWFLFFNSSVQIVSFKLILFHSWNNETMLDGSQPLQYSLNIVVFSCFYMKPNELFAASIYSLIEKIASLEKVFCFFLYWEQAEKLVHCCRISGNSQTGILLEK